MPTEFRLCDEDLAQYGGPEWVPFDRDQLHDVPFDELHKWEKETGIGTVVLLAGEFAEGTALGIKGVIWLARKMNKVDTVPFKDFNIKTLKARYRDPLAGDDAVPPDGGSSEPSSETKRSKKA